MTYNGWETIGDPLGEGAQGTVYKARSPERSKELEGQLNKITHQIRQISASGPKSLVDVARLAADLVSAGSADEPSSLGALKLFHSLGGDAMEREKTRVRLQSEIKALEDLKHPSILRLLDASHLDVDAPFIVTEYFPGGTLHQRLKRYVGQTIEALAVFRSLVEAVVAIHAKNAIHRDIKPKNIFVGVNGQLVLGDFGIVLFKDAEGRVTETYDRPGSRDWMAPWVNAEHRFALGEVNPTLDIFPLGKVLWCMISGRHQLQYWYFNRAGKGSLPPNNLEALFPDDPSMSIVNSLLAKCIVEEEDACLKTAAELLTEVDKAIAKVRAMGQRQEDGSPWLCAVCRKGSYQKTKLRWNARFSVTPSAGEEHVELLNVYFCDYCGHLEMFRPTVSS